MTVRFTLAAATAVYLCACGADAERGAASDEAAAASAGERSGGAPAAVAAEPLPAGCDLLPRAEIERIAGPLLGEPKRENAGCWYYVAMDTTTAEWKQVRAGAERARAGGMDERAIELYHPTRARLYVEADVGGEGAAKQQGEGAATAGAPERQQAGTPIAGWDEVARSRRGATFHGRSGYVRVTIIQQQLSLPPETLLALANRVRDRIPDAPIAHPTADHSPQARAGNDPCSVLTRPEAEAVLGTLIVPPYRTKERTALADPSGRSCAYHTAGHRVLLLTPTWEYGRVELDASRMVSGLVRQVADLPGIEGDTLEGPWDDAVVDLTGELLLLKAPHSLGVRYLTSSTDAAGALQLARPALQRLAATPEQERPKVAASGCLPEAVVGQTVESPARLVFNAMSTAGMCNYTLAADPTVQIELGVRPAQAADELFTEIRQRVKIVRGQSAEAESIAIGEGGLAWGGPSQSEAAARSGGKVYHARMIYSLSTTIPSRKDAMVQLVTRMME